MGVHIGICDDNEEDIRILSKALYAYDASFQISNYIDGDSLLEECYEGKIIFDILFIDIYMPGMNGIEIASKLRSYNKDVKIVFVSSSNEHYIEAFDLFAFNYILKPINHEKLNHILDQALMKITKERMQKISFTYKGKSYVILCQDILHIESKDKIICFHMTDRTTLQCYNKLDGILKELPEESFIRCHQSFVVNVFHVTEMAVNYFRVGETLISISRKYLKSSKDKYFKYLFTHMNNGG